MTPLNQINAPMTGVALPVLSKISDDEQRFVRYLAQAQLVACYLTASIFAVSAGLSGPLVAMLFGPAWTAIGPIFAVLAVGGIFRSIQQVAYWAYLAKGETAAQLRMIAITRPVMIGIIVAGVPWGPVGVAVGHSVAYFLFWIVSLRHMGKHTGIDSGPLIRNALRAVLVVCVPAGIVAWTSTLLGLPSIATVALGLLMAALYVTGVSLITPSIRADLRVLMTFVRRAVGRSTNRT
jgi:PST family polysaccharide transporter